jgi:hypothetical protein
MRRIIPLSILALLIAGGSAMADRRHDNRNNHRSNHSYRSDGHSYRNSHHHSNVRAYRDYRGYRNPVHVTNGHYHFHNGYSVRYTRPYIGVRYTNYRARPVVLVENMSYVPGYVWVRGHWNWNGYEWIWISGHYAVDASYAY